VYLSIIVAVPGDVALVLLQDSRKMAPLFDEMTHSQSLGVDIRARAAPSPHRATLSPFTLCFRPDQ